MKLRKSKAQDSAEAGGSIMTTAATYKKPGILKRVSLGLANFGLGSMRGPLIQSLAMMLGAGLHVSDALHALGRETRKKPMRKIIEKIAADVDNGMALWRAMDQRSFFTPYTIALVRIGEESGNLATNLDNLAIQDERDHSMKQKVKMAMIYPSIVITLTVVIAVGLTWFVLPQLLGVLFALNVDLPFTTRMVIAASDFMTENGPIVVPLGLLILGILFTLTKLTPFGILVEWFLFHVPGIGGLIREASVARFGIILGSLLNAGVGPVEALDSLTEVTTLHRYKKFYGKFADKVRDGESFAKSFEHLRSSRKAIPISVQQIIITGEQSGRLAEVLERISVIYQAKAEETAQKLPLVLEPMLMIFIAGLVAFIAFSIITPIYSVVGNIGV